MRREGITQQAREAARLLIYGSREGRGANAARLLNEMADEIDRLLAENDQLAVRIEARAEDDSVFRLYDEAVERAQALEKHLPGCCPACGDGIDVEANGCCGACGWMPESSSRAYASLRRIEDYAATAYDLRVGLGHADGAAATLAKRILTAAREVLK